MMRNPKRSAPAEPASSSLFPGSWALGLTRKHLWNGIKWMTGTLPPQCTYLVLYLEEKSSLAKLELYTLQFVKCMHKLWCHSPCKGVREQTVLIPFSGEEINSFLRDCEKEVRAVDWGPRGVRRLGRISCKARTALNRWSGSYLPYPRRWVPPSGPKAGHLDGTQV